MPRADAGGGTAGRGHSRQGSQEGSLGRGALPPAGARAQVGVSLGGPVRSWRTLFLQDPVRAQLLLPQEDGRALLREWGHCREAGPERDIPRVG